MLLLLTFAFKDYKEIWIALVAAVCIFWMWKAGIIQELSGGHKKLSELYKTQRDEAYKDRDDAQRELRELKEYNRLLILDSKTRMEISLQEHDKEGRHL